MLLVAGEYNTKTKQLSSNVAYYAVHLSYGKGGAVDQSKSFAQQITKADFIRLANQIKAKLPKDKSKNECPECLLSPPNEQR